MGTVVPFTAVGSPPAPPAVSKGAMEAFAQIVTMSTAGVTLVKALAAALAEAAPNPAVHVIGHSLGGCVATIIGPYLRARTWPDATPRFGIHTFAAPTAGGPDFATYVDSPDWVANERHYNDWDLVPRAWTNLDDAKKWYPDPPGPAANDDVKAVITAIASLPGPHVYAQPGNTHRLHRNYKDDYDHGPSRLPARQLHLPGPARRFRCAAGPGGAGRHPQHRRRRQRGRHGRRGWSGSRGLRRRRTPSRTAASARARRPTGSGWTALAARGRHT
ncbi:hypothetical protein ACFRCG_03910 [Embleya sp. NPDC056575]|uniref:lipase family protein n=1 Tax=unclassified Embleya TaxID=2699296 RepID=UPI0036A0BB73